VRESSARSRAQIDLTASNRRLRQQLTVGVVLCVLCGRKKDPSELGWVTVLAEERVHRIHYCPDCMEELVKRPTPNDADRSV
jgi:hypothetical protein